MNTVAGDRRGFDEIPEWLGVREYLLCAVLSFTRFA